MSGGVIVDLTLFDGLTFYIFPTGRHDRVYALIDLIEKYSGTVVDLHKELVRSVQLDELGDGFALIDPSQPWAPKFFKERKYTNPDTDAVVYFINWGFPNLCVENERVVDLGSARKLLIFTQTAGEDGGWQIYFSGSIRDDEDRLQQNMRKVVKYGGRVAEKERSAKIVIVLEAELDEARELFEDNPLTRAESLGWFLNCIKEKYVEFTPPPLKSMPGRIPYGEGGKIRVDFTPEDKTILVRFLAMRTHTRAGRLGNALYKELCQNEAYRERHTWESWRTQYKNNQTEYDKLITAYADSDLVFYDAHGKDPRVRLRRRLVRAGARQGDRQNPPAETGDERQAKLERFLQGRQRKRSQTRQDDEAEEEEEREEEAENGPIAQGDEDNEFEAYDEIAEPQEFGTFDEEIGKMPRSTPPATFGSSRTTLVGNGSGMVSAPPTQFRPPTPTEQKRAERYGGVYGIPTRSEEESSEEDELNATEDENALIPMESDEEEDIPASAEARPETQPASSQLPRLDMIQKRRERDGSGAQPTRGSNRIQNPQEQEDEDEEDLPARSFEVTRSVRRSSSSLADSGGPIRTSRYQRAAQRAVRASGIFPTANGRTRATTTK